MVKPAVKKNIYHKAIINQQDWEEKKPVKNS
jgi:hypothetical protein